MWMWLVGEEIVEAYVKDGEWICVYGIGQTQKFGYKGLLNEEEILETDGMWKLEA